MVGEELLRSALVEVAQARFDPSEWRPSELGHPCDRYLVLKRTGTPGREPDTKDLGYFQRGRIVEEWVLSLYRRQWPRKTRRQLPVRIPVNDDLTLTGHVDLWVPHQGLVVEVKSVSPSAIESGNLPRPDDLLQVRLYLDALGRRFRRDDLTGELVYVSLGRELAWRVFPVLPNALQVQQAKARVVMLEAMARAGEVPNVPYWPDQYPCAWTDAGQTRTCPFFEHCHDQDRSTALLDEPPSLAQLADIVRAWTEAKAIEDQAKQAYEDARTLRRSIEEGEIVPLAQAHGTDTLGTEDRQTVVQVRWRPGRVTWDIQAALACGAVTEAQLEPFRRDGKGWWDVRVRNRSEKGA